MREFLEILLRKEGYAVEAADGGVQAITRLDSTGTEYDLVITDLKMPHVDGLSVLRHAKHVSPETEVILMTAFSTTETAIEAMKLGAYDYISKPFRVEEIKVVIQKGLERRLLSLENRRLKGQLQQRYAFHNIVGKSSAIRQVFSVIERVARTRTSILLAGETGTGKELVAKAIHYNSPRRDGPFIVINCGAIPEQLMESELFGHAKGSFTGAVFDKKGLFEEAIGGTLFLDEVGELPLPLQVKLLRALQERRIKRIGGTRELEVDVRIVAATNRDLEREVAADRFRQDLYYRLNVVQMRVPPLRERREDIPLLIQHFLERFREEYGTPVCGIDPDALELLMRYSFDGNVRELENIIERAVNFETTASITVSSLPGGVRDRQVQPAVIGEVVVTGSGVDVESILADLERKYLVEALRVAGGVRTDAAKLLKISFRSIRYKLQKYQIEDDEL